MIHMIVHGGGGERRRGGLGVWGEGGLGVWGGGGGFGVCVCVWGGGLSNAMKIPLRP